MTPANAATCFVRVCRMYLLANQTVGLQQLAADNQLEGARVVGFLNPTTNNPD